MAKRVVLAYSGGLDTSVAVRWLQEELGVEVIAVALDVGQGGDFEVVRSRALAAGAVEAVVDRRPGRDGRGLRGARHRRQRPLRGQVPARVVAVAAGHRAPPGGRGAPPRRRRRGPRLHRQGQRPGPLRGGHPHAGARPRDPGPGPQLGHDPRGLRRVRGAHSGSRSRPPRRSCTRSTRTCGAGPSSAARSRTRGPRRPTTSSRSPARPPPSRATW